MHLARHRHTPPWNIQDLNDAIEQLTELEIIPSTISRIATGHRGAYDWEVAAFAQALDVSADWLLGLSTQLRSKKAIQPEQRR